MANENASVATRSTRPSRWGWRNLLVAGGLALWLGSMALRTGVGTFVALWNVLLLMGALVIVTIPTRTVTVIELLAPFSLGGAMIGLAVFAGWAFDLAIGTKVGTIRALGMPLVEEVLKIAPVLWILWRQRQRRAWTFGATDILLMATASGAAFYWVEEAFIIHNHGSWSFVGRFPTTEITSYGNGSYLVANHAIWTAIAGLTIGISLLLRGPRLRMLLIGAAGWAWAVLDHGANNYNSNFRDAMSKVFNIVTVDGHLSLYIFSLGVCFAVALDLYFAYFAVRAAKSKFPPFPASWNEAKTALHYLCLRRQFAYADARCRSARGNVRTRLSVLSSALAAALRNWPVLASDCTSA
jgi:hypothetical protein